MALLLLTGCVESQRPLKYLTEGAIADYQLAATQIAEPIDCSPLEIVSPLEPRRLRAPRRDELWDMPLAEAIHTALANAKIIRNDQQFLARQNALTASTPNVPSVFDPAIQQTAFGFNRGVEAALADFDTRFTTQMLWGRNEQVQNNAVIAGGIRPGNELVEDTGDFNATLEKRNALGGTMTLRNDWDYNWNNRPNQLFDSTYRGFVSAGYRQPLWAGSGVEFNRIVGPFIGDNQLNADQGVVIARINEDVSLADFEADVINLLRDVEELYWGLALTYHAYDSEVSARNAAKGTWQIEKSRRSKGIGSAAREAQARDAYFDAKARSENALADLYESETRLRRLLGLTVNDGRIIRPADDPISAEVDLDWQTSLVTALMQRVEIRRQKFQIRSLDLQLRAAHSLTNPRLDFVSEYRVNGFGDDLLFHSDDDGFTGQGFGNAYETITQGKQTGWTLGFEFSVPIGFRTAHTRVGNTELRLAKARAGLAALELEVGHELAIAFQRVDRALVTAKSNFGRWHAAKEREAALEQTAYKSQGGSVDELLRAQTSVAQAKTAYYTSLVQYNQSLAELHYRAGTLLAHNRVHLMEGDWCGDAYDLAVRRAVARAHAWDASKLLESEPEPIATPHTPILRAYAAVDGEPPANSYEDPLVPVPQPDDPPSSEPSPANPPRATNPDVAPPRPRAQPREQPDASNGFQLPLSTAGHDAATGWQRRGTTKFAPPMPAPEPPAAPRIVPPASAPVRSSLRIEPARTAKPGPLSASTDGPGPTITPGVPTRRTRPARESHREPLLLIRPQGS